MGTEVRRALEGGAPVGTVFGVEGAGGRWCLVWRVLEGGAPLERCSVWRVLEGDGVRCRMPADAEPASSATPGVHVSTGMLLAAQCAVHPGVHPPQHGQTP